MHRGFDVTPLNLAGRGTSGRLAAGLAVRRWRGDAIVLLHSVFSNAQLLAGRMLDRLAARPEPKVFFIGNEYKLMPDKMAFCDALHVSLLVSQSSSPAIHRLYRERLNCAVVGIPNTGLDAQLFQPTCARAGRPIDLGYRSERSPAYLGHAEREDITEYFRSHAQRHGVTVDLSLESRDRFDEPGWAAFLNRCKGQLGTEAGGDYFDLTDRTRLAVIEYELAHPDATFGDVFAHCFRPGAGHVPLRILSGRNVEAAGTRTVQILFDGHYDGYFKPDEHYIALRKDFSNVDEVIRKFKDPSFSDHVADNAYRLVSSELTYTALIDRFETALAALASPSLVH